jgi:hypothetical protein
MTATAGQLQAYERLRACGASHLEAATTIQAAADLDRVTINLGRASLAYLHERRGRGGQWASSGVGSAIRESGGYGGGGQGAMSTKVARRQARERARQDRAASEKAAADTATTIAREQALKVHEEKAAADLKKVMGQVTEMHDKAQAEEATADGLERKKTFISHAAFIVTGGILAATEAKLGMNGITSMLVQTGTMTAAGFGQELVDLVKKLG